MKYILLFVIISFTSIGHSQCKYSLIEYDNASGKGILKTYPITLDFYETPFNGRITLVYLSRVGNQYFIELEISEDSAATDLEPICLEKGARLSLLLKNNTIVSLQQIDDKICGVKTVDKKSGFTTVSNYGSFVLTQSDFDKLLESEALLIKIMSKDFNKNIVLKDELEEPVGNEIKVTYPGRFFIDNIKCLTNPKFE